MDIHLSRLPPLTNPVNSERAVPTAQDPGRPGAYLVGICGSGMRALAEFLSDGGWQLAGRDRNCSPADRRHLEHLGIAIDAPDGPPNLSIQPKLMIHSVAIPLHDTARQYARLSGLPDLSYPAFLGQLQATRDTICIAGTHGKSTATALTAWTLQQLGHRPGVLVGAEFRELQRSGWDAGGSPLVVESCEYQRSFLNYTPRAAAILSVEPDHFDCYPTTAALHAAFGSFASRILPGGLLVTVGAVADAVDWKQHCSAHWIRVGEEGVGGPWNWSFDRLTSTSSGLDFRILREGRFWSQARILAGPRHNALNALVALALCDSQTSLDDAGVRPRAIEALARFPGLHRRFEVHLGEANRILVDDYAHHPTAVEATIRGTRAIFPGRRLIGVFQPHQMSRTEALFAEFASALAKLDRCFLTPVYAAREETTAQETAALTQRLRQAVIDWGTPCEILFALDPIPRSLDDSFCSGDLLLTLGAGDISRLHHAFIQRFRRDHPAG